MGQRREPVWSRVETTHSVNCLSNQRICVLLVFENRFFFCLPPCNFFLSPFLSCFITFFPTVICCIPFMLAWNNIHCDQHVCLIVCRKNKEERKKTFSKLSSYYAARKLKQRIRPRKQVVTSSESVPSAESERVSKRDDMLSFVKVLELQEKHAENHCCPLDCVNSVLHPRLIHEKRKRLYETLSHRERRELCVQEIRAFQVVTSPRLVHDVQSWARLKRIWIGAAGHL
jgi:hypothetical protein